MATLHGAAATSAGWAWFGGGSLAAGGGGIGHFVLPKIGTAVAISVSSVLEHRKANERFKQLGELKSVNQGNALILQSIADLTAKYAAAETKLKEESDALLQAVEISSSRLMRFGILSQIWKRIRYYIFGYFYTYNEMEEVARLEIAVEKFMAAFQRGR
jgi:hypothetical protein